MATGFSLAPIPKWYFADNFGRPLGAGKMYTYSNLNKTQPKAVYQDPNGVFPWTNPILFNLNGEQGPFYWEFNTLVPEDTYYLEVYDKDDVLQFTIENYFPPGGSGGGGGNTFVTTKNLISNNIFLNNVGSLVPSANTDTIIAPGPHFGLNPSMADIRFIKTSSVNATDQLSFIDFNLGDDPFVGDVTPVQYLRYDCSVSGTETEKIIRFPITSKVANLDNQSLVFTFWGRCLSGNPDIELFQYQFFGQPIVTTPVVTLVQTFTLTSDWVRYNATFVVPGVGSGTLGACGDDGYFLQLQYPLSSTTSIDIAKPCLYVGTIDPGKDFATNDQTIAEIDGPRTGDVRVSINNFAPFGWVEMNDGTIGSPNSGVAVNNRNNIDTFPLFKTIWTQFGHATPALAPIFTSTGLPSTYGASPEADYAADKRISLNKQLGRALAGIGLASSGSVTTRVLGEINGADSVTLNVSQMPSHNHPGSTFHLDHFVINLGSGGTFNAYGPPGPGGIQDTIGVTVASDGGNLPHNNIQPTIHYRIFMKL